MANERAYAGSIGGKQAVVGVSLPLGTETVAATIGTNDILVVVSDAAAATGQTTEIQNLIQQVSDRIRELSLQAS